MDENQDHPFHSRRRAAARTLGFGLILFFVGMILMFAPLLLGRGSLNKYLVAFGFIATCCALSCFLHGAWDWWRA